MTTVQFTEWLHSELDAVFNHDTTPEQVMLKVIPMMFEVKKALQQCNVSGALPLTKDPFEFIADSMEKELRLRQMIDKWCIDQLGNTDAALEKAETMFVAARDTFYRQ